MEQILKNIKKELQSIKKESNLKYNHINNHYQETLKYTAFFTLNREKHFLEFRFIYQKKEESLSFLYNYVLNSKNKVVNETHSLADFPEQELPGISTEDQEQIKNLYKFEVVDNHVKNTVSVDLQYSIIMTLFKNNYQAIMKYAKNGIKTKKIPE